MFLHLSAVLLALLLVINVFGSLRAHPAAGLPRDFEHDAGGHPHRRLLRGVLLPKICVTMAAKGQPARDEPHGNPKRKCYPFDMR